MELAPTLRQACQEQRAHPGRRAAGAHSGCWATAPRWAPPLPGPPSCSTHGMRAACCRQPAPSRLCWKRRWLLSRVNPRVPHALGRHRTSAGQRVGGRRGTLDLLPAAGACLERACTTSAASPCLWTCRWGRGADTPATSCSAQAAQSSPCAATGSCWPGRRPQAQALQSRGYAAGCPTWQASWSGEPLWHSWQSTWRCQRQAGHSQHSTGKGARQNGGSWSDRARPSRGPGRSQRGSWRRQACQAASAARPTAHDSSRACPS